MEIALVTGGAGFIGSHLCDALIGKGFKVVCIDNFLTGSKKNIEHLIKNQNFKFIKDDITNFTDYKLLTSNYLFHLASPASPVDYQNHPEETALANSLGTLNMLKTAVENKAKFLFASTSEVYGNPLVHPQKETYWGNVNSFGPRSCYDESKRFAEALAYIYIKKYKLDARIVRIFNTYGPRMQKDDGRVVSNFINQAIVGKPLTVYGDGAQTRSFCYVTDLVDGILKAMFSKSTKGEIFNLGNSEEYKIIDLAQKIKSLASSKSELVFEPLPQDDPTQRKPDIKKAREILGWEPKVSLDEGLRKTIDYYKSLL
ncbi:NAD-dependent dehydratase [Candidatus Woesebacteria bacterium RBG_13_34_9]|uniref:UDP-glucuronate decarboxylase n=1 Tax=Candidatus Woesebacteria bacterium RBG_13_34_9 TaxID=1802477 RepID=A0A1F7X3J6_9BACT|nr:MAG: NAD-dependent dehydratase [Candidatus Woesebacteria bacterium RBG_13_34_9]